MLKNLSLIVILVTVSSPVMAQEVVRGYITRNGTYVSPYIRSTPDGNPYNNYSYQYGEQRYEYGRPVPSFEMDAYPEYYAPMLPRDDQ